MSAHKRPLSPVSPVGVETFGMSSADIDAEIILLTARMWQLFGLENAVTLQLNRQQRSARRYKEALVAYLSQHKDALDEDSQRRLTSNPLRVLDSKDPATQAILVKAPKLHDHLDEESLCTSTSCAPFWTPQAWKYEINQRLVRGWIITAKPYLNG